MPKTPDRLTAVQYLRFIDMLSRIRTLEHVATQHFLRGNSARRVEIVEAVRREVATTPNSLLTPDDYPLFNEMVTRIRTLEHDATTRFFGGNSGRRTQIVNEVKSGVATAHRNLFTVPARDGTVAGRCSFPYCASPGGTCELCAVDQIQQRLLAAAARIDRGTEQ